MDLSFTKNPEWIAQRELLWKDVEEPIRQALTRKEVLAIKHYFLTGEKPAKILDVGAILYLFPVFTVEGIQYCLTNYVDISISDKDFLYIQHTLVSQSMVAGVSALEKKSIFEYIYGEIYEKKRYFPFLIDSEDNYRLIGVDPNYLLSVCTSAHFYIKNNNPDYKTHCIYLQQYMFSLFPYVDRRIFDEDIAEKKISIGGAMLHVIRGRLNVIIDACFTLPNPSENPKDDRDRMTYLNEFRSRMDALEEPVELKQIWESIKAKYQ